MFTLQVLTFGPFREFLFKLRLHAERPTAVGTLFPLNTLRTGVCAEAPSETCLSDAAVIPMLAPAPLSVSGGKVVSALFLLVTNCSANTTA